MPYLMVGIEIEVQMRLLDGQSYKLAHEFKDEVIRQFQQQALSDIVLVNPRDEADFDPHSEAWMLADDTTIKTAAAREEIECKEI